MKKFLFRIDNIVFLLTGCLFLIQGCITAPEHPSLIDSDMPKMIRIKELFFNIKPKSNFQVSPDGKKIAWLGGRKEKTAIFFKTIGKDDTRYLRHNFIKSTVHFKTFYWAYDSRHILYPVWEEFGNQNHIYIADTHYPEKVARNLTPDTDHSYSLERLIRDDPEHIILAKYKCAETIIKASTIELVKLNIISAKKQLSAKKTENKTGPASGDFKDLSVNPGNVYSWMVDNNGTLRARITVNNMTKRVLEVKNPESKIWGPVLNWTIDDSVRFLNFSPDNSSIYLLSNIGRDRIGLISLNLETRKQKLIADNPKSDLESVFISNTTGRPIAAAAYPDYQKIHLLDPDYKDLFEMDGISKKTAVFPLSLDNQERLITVKVITGTNIAWYLYNRVTKEKQLLGTRFSPEFSEMLSDMKPISFTSRDGLKINGYLTIPKGTSGKNLPMVLYVHGGPWSRDYWRLDRSVQLLANRGYAVLQINFRGSSGYGRIFMEAAKGEFARKMHKDLIDGVDWAIKQGIADPEKIGILGYSYGGYAVLTGLTITPEVFTCGISVNGISNLDTFIRSKDIKDNDYKNWYKWQTYVGNPESQEDQAAIKARSPFYHVDKISKPLLIVQGAKDERVPRSEADTMVKALKSADKEVKYILFPRESHHIRWWSNQFRLLNNMEKFFGKHLGGRSILSDSLR